MPRKRRWCHYCFSTLSPQDASAELWAIVECKTCKALFHESCWVKSDGCLSCGGSESQSATIPRPRPLKISNKKRALRIIPSDTVDLARDGEAAKLGKSKQAIDGGFLRLALFAVTFGAVFTIIGLVVTLLNSELLPDDQFAVTPNSEAELAGTVASTNTGRLSENVSRPKRATSTATLKLTHTRVQTPTLAKTSAPKVTPQRMVEGITIAGVNLRAGPGTNYDKIGVLMLGTSVNILDQTSDGKWYRVQLPERKIVWIAADYVKTESAAHAIPTVALTLISPTPTFSLVADTPTVTTTHTD